MEPQGSLGSIPVLELGYKCDLTLAIWWSQAGNGQLELLESRNPELYWINCLNWRDLGWDVLYLTPWKASDGFRLYFPE